MSENEASRIAENKIKSPVSGEVVPLKSLWENQTCVIVFLRRFGCGFCRLAAKQISNIKPHLDANNVRLVAIGVEELGVEEFMNEKFFDGDLFIDQEKKTYQDLKFKRYNMLNIVPAMLVKTSRDALSSVRAEKLGGNMKGDIYQVGGALIVTKGGDEVLLMHKQESLADHVKPEAVLKLLNIEVETKSEGGDSGPEKKTDAKAENEADAKTDNGVPN